MKETIIQFGEGGFLRSFADVFVHKMNEQGVYDGKVVVVQPIAKGLIPVIGQRHSVVHSGGYGIQTAQPVMTDSLAHSGNSFAVDRLRGLSGQFCSREYCAGGPQQHFGDSQICNGNGFLERCIRPDLRFCPLRGLQLQGHGQFKGGVAARKLGPVIALQ